MGSDLSRPRYYSSPHLRRSYGIRYGPADTLRICSGDLRCTCTYAHTGRRYLYLDPYGIRAPRPYDPMAHLLRGGGMPHDWGDPQDWSIRDFEVLGGMMGEISERVGRVIGRGSGQGQYGTRYGGGGGEYEQMMQRVHDISREHSRRLEELEDNLGVSDRAMRNEAYLRRMREQVRGFMQMGREMDGRGRSGMGLGAGVNQNINVSGGIGDDYYYDGDNYDGYGCGYDAFARCNHGYGGLCGYGYPLGRRCCRR